MADYCSILESQKCQTLSEMSGISKDSIALMCNASLDLNNRFPELDEINGDSTQYLIKELDLHNTKSGTYYQNTKTILDSFGEDLPEANAQINDVHKDLEVKITDIDGTAIFEIERRPSIYRVGDTPYRVNAISKTQKSAALTEALFRMQKLYGIKIIPITSKDEFPEELNVSQSKAFIYNGNIYINTDLASVDSPIHEILHIFMGGMSRSNPQLFYNLIGLAEQLPSFEERAKYYPNRTRSDINEEIFVEEFAKYLTNQDSLFSQLDNAVINQIMYYVERDLDTILKGNYSIRSIDSIFDYSLIELAELTESNSFNMTNGGILTDATIHRMLANTKEEYLKNGKLTENCE